MNSGNKKKPSAPLKNGCSRPAVVTPLEIKTRMLQLGITAVDLGRMIRRRRRKKKVRRVTPIPRSTVSQAIHTNKFPLVRARIEEVLWS